MSCARWEHCRYPFRVVTVAAHTVTRRGTFWHFLVFILIGYIIALLTYCSAKRDARTTLVDGCIIPRCVVVVGGEDAIIIIIEKIKYLLEDLNITN